MSVTVYDAKKITELADGGVVNTATDKLLVSRGVLPTKPLLGRRLLTTLMILLQLTH